MKLNQNIAEHSSSRHEGAKYFGRAGQTYCVSQGIKGGAGGGIPADGIDPSSCLLS